MKPEEKNENLLPTPSEAEVRRMLKFATLDEFAAWLEDDLVRIEELYADWRTNNSIMKSIGR